MTQYAYSLNEDCTNFEEGRFDSFEEAIRDAICKHAPKYTHCWVGGITDHTMEEFLPHILNCIEESVYDTCLEYPEFKIRNFEKVTEKELKDALIQVFENKGIRTEYCFSTVGNCQRYELCSPTT